MNFLSYIGKVYAAVIISACFFFAIDAQNLVPNGSFEILDSCHASTSLNNSTVNYAPIWDGTINGGTPDIFQLCNGSVPYSTFYGYQAAQDGGNYIGMLSYEKQIEEREYISTKLSDTLKAGQRYYVGFYVSLANRFSDYEVRNIGAYLADTLIYSGANFGVLPFSPQIINNPAQSLKDTMNWVLVADTFYAVGNERYIAVGNFFTDINTQAILTGWNDPIHDSTAYYYIDNVFVYEIPGLTGIKKQEPGNINVSLYPNPNSGEFTITASHSFERGKIHFYDLNDKLVHDHSLNGQKINLSLSELNEGIYFYTITEGSRLLKRDKVVIIR